MVDGDGWRMLRGEAQGGTGWDGRMVGSMNGDKGTGEGSRWMLWYCRHRPLLPLPSFPHPGACRRGNTETHRLPGRKGRHWLPPRLSNNSLDRANATSPLRPPPCGWCGDGGSASRGCPEPRSTSPADLDTVDGGVAGTDGVWDPRKIKSAPTSKASRSSSRSVSRGRREAPSVATRPSPRASVRRILGTYLTESRIHKVVHSRLFIQIFLLPFPHARRTAGLMHRVQDACNVGLEREGLVDQVAAPLGADTPRGRLGES